MTLYMLDTNSVSAFLKRAPQVTSRILSVAMSELCISSITAGELRYGLAKRPEAARIALLVDEFLKRVDVLSWDAGTSEHYGRLRASIEKIGRSLAPLDLLIAAHAVASDAVLVSADKAFADLPGILLEDWSIPTA